MNSTVYHIKLVQDEKKSGEIKVKKGSPFEVQNVARWKICTQENIFLFCRKKLWDV